LFLLILYLLFKPKAKPKSKEQKQAEIFEEYKRKLDKDLSNIKDVTLLNQAFVKDGKVAVKDYLKQADADLTVTAFDRYTLNA